MSSNLNVAWPLGIICVSDRRLTNFLTGKVTTNRSTKMTIFGCADAHGVIVYNGIGMDDAGRTPSQWLLDLAEKKLFDGSLADILSGVAVDSESRLQPLRTKYGPRKARHTFVFAVWQKGVPSLYCISNYERADEPGEAAKGSAEVMQSKDASTPECPIRMLATGAHPSRRDLQAISDAIKRLASPNRVKALCVKAVKDISYGKGRGRGTVGASCQWAFLGQRKTEVWYGLDVVGGAVAQEPPNLINIAAEMPLGGTMSVRMGGPGMLFADAYAGGEEARSVARYDPVQKRAVFSELLCGICGNPLPAAHRTCEVCSYEQHRDQSK